MRTPNPAAQLALAIGEVLRDKDSVDVEFVVPAEE